MSGELNMFVTSVTSSGPHIKFYAQLHTEKYAALDSVISANQNQFDVSTLSSPYELKPGELVLVKSLTGASAKWHRARVNNIQSIEYGTVAIQFIDYGTNEVVHYSQICTSMNPVAASILAQPPLAVECVLADVVPALAIWADAAISFAESKLLFQVVRGQLVRQDGPDGPLHVRAYGADGVSLAQQLAALGLGRPAQTGAVPPGYQTGGGYGGASGHPPPSATPPQPTEFAVRVKEMTTAPAQPGSELPVTVCHYSNGPAKFAIQNHQQRDTLRQLMADIQAYCQTSRPAPVPMLEPGAVCLGASASRDGQFLRGVITQVDGGLVKVYWADFGHDETKSAGELRAMPRQFVGPWIQASRVSLAGLEGLVAAPSAAHTFRELTDGRLLTCRFRGKDQPNQVDLYDRDQSVLDQLLQLGAYTMPGASSLPPRGAVPQPAPLQHPPPSRSPASAYPPPSRSPAAAAAPSGPVLTPGSTSEVLVVEVGAVNNLYVRVAASEGQLNQLLHQLAEQLSAGGQQLPPSSCRVGTLCAVRKDGGYQRARVVSLGRRDLKVQYVDVGSSELVPLQAVLALDQRFATLPPQAFHCCLEGLETTHGSAEHVRQLQAITANARLLCTVVSQPAADRRVVRLSDPRRQPPLDINAMMREAVAAAGPPPAQQGQLIRDSGPAAPAVSGPPVEPGRREQLVVMHVESPARWFGQLAKLDADALAAMEEAMQSRYTQGRAPPPLSSAPLGTHCAAFSAVHEAIFRAKVVSRQGTQVTVFFIDYGDTEETSVAKLFPLLAEFTQLPQLGISCALRGAEAVPPDTFRSVLLNQTVDVLLHSPRPGPGTDIYDVSLAADSAVNRAVMEQLVPAGLRTAPEGGSTPQPQRRPAAGSSLTLPQQQLPVGVYKEVEVVHVVSPAEFYVQLKEQFPAIDAVQEQVAGYASAPPPSAAPVSGALVAALYPDDGLWYRGRVMAADATGKVTVFFVDYGDTRALSASEVRALRPEHASLAGQAIRCCSSDVGRHGRKDFTEQETASFRSAVLEVPYLARCEETRAGTAVVTLAKAELLEPVLDAPASAVPPPVTRQISGEQRKPPPRADMDPNWRERPAGGVTPTSPPAGDPFSGRMRMDQPESYSRPQRSSRPSGDGWGSGGGDGWGSGGGGGGGGGGNDSRSGGGRERSWQGHDDRGSEERGWGGSGGGGGGGGGGSGDSRGPRGAPDGAGARQADSWSSGGRQDRAPAPSAGAGGGGGHGGRPGSGRTRTSAGGGDDWSSNSSTTSGGGGGARQPTPAVSIPEHSARLTYTALRPGAELRAAPTWVCGLHEFFVQPLDGAEPFSKLMTEMQTFYGGLRRPQDGSEPGAAAGRPVAARFTDGAWYRAVVTKCAPTELAVHFVDYGNSATVDRRLVKRLKEEYCKLPPQAYRCQFGGVKPVGGKWKVLSEKELAKYFADEIQVTCLSAEGALSLVEVTLAASGQRATDQLVAAGLAERPAAARPLQQSDIGPFPPLERAFAAGERVEVFVACVLSPSRLYIQLSENTEQIEQMAADIEKSTADCQVPCPDVSTGEICLAPFEGVYYRGVITAVEGQNASIYFVDYGNTERIDVGELVECPMHLVDLPAQALQCSMTGVPASCGPQLAATIDQMELTALVDRVLPGSLVVTLLTGGKNINLQLGGDGQARSPEPVTGKTTASVSSAAAPAAAPVTQATTAPTQAAAAATASTPFSRVTVSYAESPAEFYVQDSADGPAAQLDEVMAKLETEYAQLAPEDRAVTQVQTGDLVAAPFADDGVFYRARLLSAEPSAAECQLQFIDYGNCQLTPRGQLKRLTPELLAPAPLAQRCRLPERPAGAAEWTDEHTERFEQLAGTLEKVLQLRRVEDGAAGDVWTVRLLDGPVDVGQELVKAGCALPPEEKTPAAAAPAIPAPAAPAEVAARPAGPAGLARLKKGCLLEAAVVFALSPTDFWVQLSADIATLDDLMARLEAAQLTPAPAPAVGHLLVARYAEDEALYRARVLSTSPDGAATVLFVDYGNKETVPAGELWSCPPDLAATPPLAVRCSLPLEPQPWSDDAVEKFSELVGVGGAEERTLNLELVRTGDPALVNLFYEQQDVAFEMVGAGFGNVHVEERPTPVRETPPAEKPISEPVAESETATAATESETSAQTEESSDSTAAAASAPTGEELVLVSHVNSPLEFYVQAADTAPLDDLMERLTIDFESAEPVSEVKPGTLAAAPYSEDGAPYRARVLSVQDDTARVLFVDYGNSESVAVSDLRQLSGELASLPPQARPCQLDVEACQEEAADRLRELVQTEETVTMRQLAAGAVSRVKLTLPAGDAAGMLVADGLCQQRAAATLPAPPPPPSAPVRLLVSHVDSPACFFVQLRREMAALDELADLLGELYDTPAEPPLPLAAPCCGDLCVARIPGEDGGWFRAHVERVTGAGEVQVRLADYGSTAAAAEVRTAAPAVCRAPAMALRCRLPARPADGAEWSQEAAATLAELVDAACHRLDARLVPDPAAAAAAAAGSPLVALLSHQGRSVALMLQERMKEHGVEMIPEPLAAEGVTVEAEERAAREGKPADAQAAEQEVTKRMDDLTLTEGKEEQATESADNTTASESAGNTEEAADGSNQDADEVKSDDDAGKPAEEKIALDETEKPGESEELTDEKSDETKTDTADEHKSPDTEDAEADDQCPPKSPEPAAPEAAETESEDDTPAPAEAEADGDTPAPVEGDGDAPAPPVEGDEDTPAPVEADKDTPAPAEGTEDDENVVGGDGDKPAPAECSGETPAPAAETDCDGDKPASDEGGDSSASVVETQGSGDATAAAEDGDDTSPPSADASTPAESDAKVAVTESSGGDAKTPGPAAVTEGSGGDAPGNGHASPVNGREGGEQHGDATSAGGKAVSAGRESPDAADGAQAAA